MVILTQKRAQEIRVAHTETQQKKTRKLIKAIRTFIEKYPLELYVRLDTSHVETVKYQTVRSLDFVNVKSLWLTPQGEFELISTEVREVPRYIFGTSSSISPGIRCGSDMVERQSGRKVLSLEEAVGLIDEEKFEALKQDVLKEIGGQLLKSRNVP